MLKYLRIAFSVLCGIVCLLLVALWVRSYRYRDVLEKKLSNGPLQIHSMKGRIAYWHQQFRTTHRVTASYRATLLNELSQGRAFVSNPVADTRRFPGENGVLGFGRHVRGMTTIVILPYWFAVLLTAGCAIAPQFKWSRRFSLRTLLIATTLVAVVLGLVVYFV